MLNGIRKCFLAWQMRRRIRLATEVIYSERFDIDTLVGNLAHNSKSVNLLRAYIAIRVAADTKRQKEIQMADVLKEIHSSEVFLGEPELRQAILDLRKAEAKKSLIEAEMMFYMDRLAPQYSYRGIIYNAEKAKKGPLSQRGHEKLKILSDKLAEVECEIEDAANRPEEDITSKKDT